MIVFFFLNKMGALHVQAQSVLGVEALTALLALEGLVLERKAPVVFFSF